MSLQWLSVRCTLQWSFSHLLRSFGAQESDLLYLLHEIRLSLFEAPTFAACMHLISADNTSWLVCRTRGQSSTPFQWHAIKIEVSVARFRPFEVD